MSSDLRTCPECGAALDSVSAQMEHWDWHRNMRSRLSELEVRIDALGRATGLDAVWRQQELEERGSE